MEKNIYSLALLLLIFILSCNNNNNSEKHQSQRDNVINVHDKVEEIQIEDVLLSSFARLYLLDNYLIISDSKAYDEMLIHLFSKNNFEYVTSALPKGQGPSEITNMGHIEVNERSKELYVSDHGKLKIFSYPLDSILDNAYNTPEVKKEINNIQFPSNYIFINDTLSFARIIVPTGNIGHNELLAKWNMQTGEINKMKYTHPKVETKRIALAVSMDNETLVECYHNHDLMTIMDLNGNLKYNVYGQNWNNRDASRINHFGKVVFRGDKIIASYSGGDMSTDEYYPTKLLIFDINGDYIKTLEIGYRISDLCYDEENDRIIFALDDVIQFAFLDLKEYIL